MASARQPLDVFNVSQMMKQLECPVCLNACAPPIAQCENGHILCSSCRSLLTECPICRGKMSVTRNIYAEQTSEVKYPCTNLEKGCKEKIMLRDMETHLGGCVFSKSRCFLHVGAMNAESRYCFSPCSWTGKSAELLDHVAKTHPESLSSSCTVDVAYKMRKQHFLLVAAHGQLFWSTLNYDLRTFDLRGAVFAVDTIKPPAAFRFQYDLESPGGTLHITKRGTVCNLGFSDEKYNSTIFQGQRVADQMIVDKKLKFRIKITKALSGA